MGGCGPCWDNAQCARKRCGQSVNANSWIIGTYFGECHCASSSMKKRTNKGTAPAEHLQMNRLSILFANKYVAKSNDAVHQIHSYNLIKTERKKKTHSPVSVVLLLGFCGPTHETDMTTWGFWFMLNFGRARQNCVMLFLNFEFSMENWSQSRVNLSVVFSEARTVSNSSYAYVMELRHRTSHVWKTENHSTIRNI